MLNYDRFRRTTWIAAIGCFLVSVVTILVSFTAIGQACPVFEQSPAWIWPVFMTFGFGLQAVRSQHYHDKIESMKVQLETLPWAPLVSPLMTWINWDVYATILAAVFIAGSMLPLFLLFFQCR